MILYIASSTLEDLSITVIHLSPQEMRQEMEAEKMSQAKRRQELDQETEREILVAVVKARNSNRDSTKKHRTSLSSKQQEIWLKRRLGGRNKRLVPSSVRGAQESGEGTGTSETHIDSSNCVISLVSDSQNGQIQQLRRVPSAVTHTARPSEAGV